MGEVVPQEADEIIPSWLAQVSASGAERHALVKSVSEKAYAQFAKVGLPRAKSEEWKYTNLAPLQQEQFAFVSSVCAAKTAQELLARVGIPVEAKRFVFFNGEFSEDNSNTSSLPAGLSVHAFSELLSRQSSDELRGLLVKKLETSLDLTPQDPSGMELGLLNASLLRDGLLIHLSKGTSLKEPLFLAFFSKSGEVPAASGFRVLVYAEEQSELTLVEAHAGEEGEKYLSSAVTEFIVEPQARVDHYRLQLESEEAYHLSQIRVHQARQSSFSTQAFAFGGGLVRNEVRPVLDGEDCETVMNGLNVLHGDQHVDNHTVLDHAKPHCRSNELYKGIYSGKSRGVFSGTIIVRQHAQKTNAFQANRSLLLSAEASSDSMPQLKIWADDVRCTHGATVGQLDDEALFYLRSRGIPRAQARDILVRAFAEDLLSGVKPAMVREFLECKLSEKLAGR